MHTYTAVGGDSVSPGRNSSRLGLVKFVAMFLLLGLAGWCVLPYFGRVPQNEPMSVPARDPPPSYRWRDDSMFANPQNRFTTHLLLDKPVYRPGEVVRGTCFVLNAFALTTPLANADESAWVTLLDSMESPVHSFQVRGAENGVWPITFQLPQQFAGGGEYSVKVTPFSREISAAERKVEIRATRAANSKLNKRIELDREGYMPGQQVSAVLTVEGAENGATVQFTANVDSNNNDALAKSDWLEVVDGKASFAFTLPMEATRGLVLAKVRNTGSGAVEQVTKTVAILTSALDIQVFPESSGDKLVRGAKQQRVYMQALHETKPADFAAEVLVDGQVVATMSSVHEGRGVSTPFDVPVLAKQVVVRLTSPLAIPPLSQQEVNVPLVTGRLSFSCLESVFANQVEFQLQTELGRGNYSLSLFKREVRVANQTLTKDHTKIVFDLTNNRDNYGVFRATLSGQFANKWMPIAERLVFRVPPHGLEFDFTPNQVLDAAPGDEVKFQLTSWMRAMNPITGMLEGERTPVAATVSVRVTDSALAATVEERLLPPRLPALVLLDSEVDTLMDAGALFPDTRFGWIKQPPKRRGTFTQRIDLLLAIQGWRRFAYTNPKNFLREYSSIPKTTRQRMFASKGDNSYKTAFLTSSKPKVMMMNAPPMLEMEDQAIAAAGAAEDNMVVEEDMAVDNVEAVEDKGMAVDNDQDDDQDELAEEDEMPQFAAKRFARPGPRSGPRASPQFERVYAFQPKRYTKKELAEQTVVNRADFTETVYSNPSLVTKCSPSPKNNGQVCRAEFAFGLSDSSSVTFVLHADGFAPMQTLLGAGQAYIRSKTEAEVDFKLPSNLVQGDLPQVPIYAQDREAVTFTSSSPNRLKVVSMGRKSGASSGFKRLETLHEFGLVNLTLASKQDSITRTTVVTPRGFPMQVFSSGMLAMGKFIRYDVPTLPADYVSGSLQANALVYTSPVGQLTKALEALIREPYGCFEQTSSVTYPLIFVLQYLQTHSGGDPRLVAMAADLLNKGYARLVSFESPGGGFEWFGEEPGHEALTAYGLLQFSAMASLGLKTVDQTMVARTRQWMERKRDGLGGYLRNPKALDAFGAAPQDTTNAYITWALVRAKLLRFQTKELDLLVQLADKSNDPYIVALAALSLYENDSDKDENKVALGFAQRLADGQDPETGVMRNAVDTITRSRGDALAIEATALAVLAWLHNTAKFGNNARLGVHYLATMCKNGRFSSTQATALTLMAIVEYDKVFSKPIPQGTVVELWVDGELVEKHTLAKTKTSGDHACSGKGAFWNECASACTPTKCGEIPAVICTMQCVAKCDCPSDKPWLASNGDCVADCSISVEKEEDEEQGVVRFSSSKLMGKLTDNSAHQIEMRLSGPEASSSTALPYSLTLSYSVNTPVSSTKVPLQVGVTLPKRQYVEGDVAEFQVSLTHSGNVTLPMVVCVVGIPGGFEPRTDQLLRELNGVVDSVEIQPGAVTLYWRAFLPNTTVRVPVQAVATVPGKYHSPATRAYAFYQDEERVWANSLEVEIVPLP
ncbi:hypothetical protein BASA81_013813 [Batrachochytrium salamandrivorans]|nr:hypothetical protein BASA81_013813 [Batrachochytrium salamandrivorans]